VAVGVLTGVKVRLLVVALAAVVAVPASPAQATHPCPLSTDGSPTYDPSYSSDHDGCAMPPSPQPGDLVLREDDAGRTVQVPVGTRLFVQFESGWTAPVWLSQVR
jgi:hypothetical protein